MVTQKSEKNSQLPITQMLSSQHDALSISVWLERWLVESGKISTVAVMDCSRALLNAAVKSFTKFKSVNAYVDYLFFNFVKL